MNKLNSILRLMRPTQWVKNTFVFLPVFLNGQLTDFLPLIYSFIAFLLFCLTSSAIYCINDAVDAPYDAVNPEKCHRPVASGEISRSEAVGVAAILIMVVVCATIFSGMANMIGLMYVLLSYFVLNLAYSLYLKSIPLIDVTVIACCFLLRICAGGAASGIHLTLWTLLLVFLLTLMLAVGKRRYEAWLCDTQGIKSRSNIKSYNVKFLNGLLIFLGVVSFTVYLCWTLSDYAEHRFDTDLLFLTSIFVASGTGRYLWLLTRRNSGGNPTRLLLHDKWILLSVTLWIVSFAIIIY